MLFKAAILDKIARGEVTLAFRRWRKPGVLPGRTLRSGAGVLAIDSVEAIGTDEITDADAVKAGFANREAVLSDLRSRRDGTLYRISFHRAAPDPREALREQDVLDENELAQLRRQLAGLDDRSRSAPWAFQTLRLIASRDGITAGEISDAIGMEKMALKLKIRKLKEFGLTESLPSGYRLSPRGRRFWKALAGDD